MSVLFPSGRLHFTLQRVRESFLSPSWPAPGTLAPAGHSAECKWWLFGFIFIALATNKVGTILLAIWLSSFRGAPLCLLLNLFVLLLIGEVSIHSPYHSHSLDELWMYCFFSSYVILSSVGVKKFILVEANLEIVSIMVSPFEYPAF